MKPKYIVNIKYYTFPRLILRRSLCKYISFLYYIYYSLGYKFTSVN
ncbi:hypothetical protein BCAH1134_C0103 (plasmid) [Bacillus cereus AH1134]|nr:hypothetical protein BCAH1134_C0103 [Bacillus cereus AH1134]